MQIDRPITIAVIIFVIILLMYFFVVPKYFEFKQVQISVAKAEAEYNGKFAYYSEVTRIYREIQERRDDFAKIDDALPSKPQLADLMYFFKKKGTEAGLVVKSINLTKVAPKTPESKVKDIYFSVDIVGTYEALKNFLSILENSSRIFEVGTIGFNSQSKNTVQAVSPTVKPTTAPTTTVTTGTISEPISLKMEIRTQSY